MNDTILNFEMGTFFDPFIKRLQLGGLSPKNKDNKSYKLLI